VFGKEAQRNPNVKELVLNVNGNLVLEQKLVVERVNKKNLIPQEKEKTEVQEE
jgi:hypothetical protein